MKNVFNHAAKTVSCFIGHPITFTLAISSVVIWLMLGPFYKFSDNWQLVMNSFTSIVTYLMIFLLQNTQNRDTNSIQIKLDELIRVHGKAKNHIIDLDKLSDDQLKELEKKYKEISKIDSSVESNGS